MKEGNKHDAKVEEPHKLNVVNYLNLSFYVVNILFVNLIGSAGLGGLPSNAEQSAKYQVRFRRY